METIHIEACSSPLELLYESVYMYALPDDVYVSYTCVCVCLSCIELFCSALNAEGTLQYKSKGERALKIYVGVSASLRFLECYLYAFTSRYHPLYFVQCWAWPDFCYANRRSGNAQLLKSTPRRLVVIANHTNTCSYSMNEEAVKTRDRISFYS